MKFGERFSAEVATSEFRDFCEERNYCLSQMRKEFELSKEKIIEKSNKYAVQRIESFIEEDLEQCPKCSGDFLYDENEDMRYCPLCYTDELP
jgi:RNA polymerase subunit RPABC4/transcription elongation factor Spt4